MNEILEDVCLGLETFASQIHEQHEESNSFLEEHGWNFPGVSAFDLAFKAKSLAQEIRTADIESLKPELLEAIEPAADRLAELTTKTVPQITGPSARQAIPVVLITLDWIDNLLRRNLYILDLAKPDRVPLQLAKRVRSINAQLDDVATNSDDVKAKIEVINNAFEAAQALPTDRQALDESRNKIEQYLNQSTDNELKISNLAKKLEKHETDLANKKAEAARIVDQCEQAYRIATTTGLAGSFESRANALANSMWIWTGGLIVSLGAAIYLGSLRLAALSSTLAESDTSNFIVVVQVLLSVIGLGAPIWFAWISTKQLGQRFRLAEDYAFKASVAKAYEGYRSEAVKIDDTFLTRLFSSTLDRVEEEPLRLIENQVHNSPLEELLTSNRFSKFLSKDPKNVGMLQAILDRERQSSERNVKKDEPQSEESDSVSTESTA